MKKNNVKAAAAAVPVSTGSSRDRGERYEGIIDKIETVFYSTGSFGLKLKYAIAGLERPVYENIVLTKLNEEGAQEPTKYGKDTFKRRLQAAGYTSEDVLGFAIPKKVTDNSEFADILGAAVAVYLRPRTYMGKDTFDVASVWPLDNN